MVLRVKAKTRTGDLEAVFGSVEKLPRILFAIIIGVY
jgi:hypothetical protein